MEITSADRLKEITDQLEKGIKELFDSGQCQEYFNAMAKFPNYSAKNCYLIFKQRPDATLVAGYGMWKQQGRQVMRGEKGIKIIAPCPYKIESEQKNPDTGKAIKQEVTISYFKVVTVLDVSQTDGKELPALGKDILLGDVENYAAFFHALQTISPVPVYFEQIKDSGTKGYCNYAQQRIAIQEDMSQTQTIATLIHEIAHATLHTYYDKKEKDTPPEQRKDRRTREVETESIAYTVCQHYHIDTSDYSFGYVAGWSGGQEMRKLYSSLETIRKTSAELIGKLDDLLLEAQREPIMQRVSGAVQDALQFLTHTDLQSKGTLKAIAMQGYALHGDKVDKSAISKKKIVKER